MFTITGRVSPFSATQAPIEGTVTASSTPSTFRDTASRTLVVEASPNRLDEAGTFTLRLPSIEGLVPSDVTYRLTVSTPSARFSTPPFGPLPTATSSTSST